MDWIQFIIFAGGVFGCFFWNRSESRADIRHMETMLKSNRDLIEEIHKETMDLMKEFHGRLCTAEERNRK